MKKYILRILIIAIVAIVAISCQKSSKNNVSASTAAITDIQDKWNCSDTLNLSIFLDLSDRIVKVTNSIRQSSKDTALINYMSECFINKVVKDKILGSKDRIQIFFYPTPDIPKIAQYAANLKVDMSVIEANKKQSTLMQLKSKWDKDLAEIYDTTIKTQNWIGSDIWGFFDNSVDNQCIRKGYRNILVILTDGYIYDKNNCIEHGDATSYLLAKTLKNPKSSLIVKRTDLKDLEVLVLEVNPNHPQNFTHMKDVICKWLKGMGIKHFGVEETDLPINTQTVIKNFIER
jgi:uncharacterized ubiquitin-like protein YukD